MAEGETLCDENRLTRCKGLEDLPRVPFGEANGLQMEEDLSIHSSNQADWSRYSTSKALKESTALTPGRKGVPLIRRVEEGQSNRK